MSAAAASHAVPAPAAAPKIQLRAVRKAFATNRVLKGVDLEVAHGESLVVIGGSGTGKSVLLKCIIGLVAPDGGSILVDGAEVVGMRGRERDATLRKFGMLFQGAALFDSLRVWENVAFGLIEGRGMDRKAARAKAMEMLGRVGLGADAGNLWPAELSGGMKKRVGLARAIATEPEILFFDEPTTGLDPIMSEVINELIVKCVRDLGATAVSITHDLASARAIADRVAMLQGGAIVWDGPVAELDHSDNAYVEQFIHGRAEGPIHVEVAAG